MTREDIIHHIYDYFNDRDIDSVFQFFHPEVAWPNGWEGGYVNGLDEVRDYWTRQWAEINPKVRPIEILTLEDGKMQVAVAQTVKDLNGNMIADSIVKHTYAFDADGLVTRMVIG